MSLNVQTPLSDHQSTFDFAKFYQPAIKNDVNENQKIPSPERTPKVIENKKSNTIVNDGNVEANNINSQATSTPYASGSKIKSIMKIKREFDYNDETFEQISYTPKAKSKKRNKSVSFLLDASDETVIKKTKSHNSSHENVSHKKEWGSEPEKKLAKLKKKGLAQEEPHATDITLSSPKLDKKTKKNTDNKIMEPTQKPPKKMRSKIFRKSKITIVSDGLKNDEKPEFINPVENMNVEDPTAEIETAQKAKKHQKSKTKQYQKTEIEISDEIPNTTTTNVIKKKKKHSNKRVIGSVVEIDGEPVIKSRKTDPSDDTITEKIESLSIGDTPHSLTNLIDEMTVSDKNIHKKDRKQFKQEKRSRSLNSQDLETLQGDGEVAMPEKVKWTKRKWNKGVKGDPNTNSTIIVEKLPLSLVLSYKQLLTDHFGKYGPIKRIGVAELYPSETLQPTFTTKMQFFDDEAATKALEDDNMPFNGENIRVLRPLPATMTTLVVRSYGELNDQSISSIFASAGKIRSIKHMVKGRNTIGTSFIEFDGPEAVEQAIKIAENAKIGWKKIHVSRFEERSSKDIDDNTGTE